MTLRFDKPFTQQEPLPDAAITRAVEVMQSGRLHRYNTLAGETSEVALLEQEFAGLVGLPYCLATTSGGTALQIALTACDVRPGDKVLTNAFTLSPVPGAIHAVGGVPVLVETNENLEIDLSDLAAKAESSGARTLLISHMRGHLADMDAVVSLCDKAGIQLIEDCAHTMGGAWREVPSGAFGRMGCFSTQTYKHINSGEGGFIVSRDAEAMARAIIRSGSYMLYDRHLAAPGPEHFKDARLDTPNCSSRLDNLRAAILRPQLADLPRQVMRWQERYNAIANELAKATGLILRRMPQAETHVGSSIQFRFPELTEAGIQRFIDANAARGVELKWFGAAEPHGYTSSHHSWRYAGTSNLPATDRILSRLFDLRIPLTFTVEDCRLIGLIIAEEARDAR